MRLLLFLLAGVLSAQTWDIVIEQGRVIDPESCSQIWAAADFESRAACRFRREYTPLPLMFLPKFGLPCVVFGLRN
jgi:hypothetical protein